MSSRHFGFDTVHQQHNLLLFCNNHHRDKSILARHSKSKEVKVLGTCFGKNNDFSTVIILQSSILKYWNSTAESSRACVCE